MLATYARFERLHSGLFHDVKQAMTTSKLASAMAGRAGYSRKESRYLAQVALLHNADERLDPKSGERRPHTAPQTHNTLDWMLQNRDALSLHFCWTKSNFNMACYLVARTCYPFDAQPRLIGQNFHGKSPVEVAAHFLEMVPTELREEAVRLALILRFADQVSNYTQNMKRVQLALTGLVVELQTGGVSVNIGDLRTGAFLAAVGTDIHQDRILALQFGVRRDDILTRDQLMDLLPPMVRRRLDSNLNSLLEAVAA